MSIEEQIENEINSHPEPKRLDMQALHTCILNALPGCKLWFENGKNADGKQIANPNVGYGFQIMKYANGKTREFFQVGMSANTTGISVYILGIDDRKYLPQTYGKIIGKASVTGYCIKFKSLKDINLEVLITAIKDGVAISAAN